MTNEFLKEAPKPTAEQLAKITKLETEAKECRQRSEESFRRSDTDGFLSQWASDITAELNDRKVQLLKTGGYSQFPVLCDDAGNVLATKIFEFADRFRPEWTGATVKRWRLPDELAAKHGRKWIPVCSLKESRIQKQLGLHEESRWFPAYAKITTGNRKSTGLAGCANAFVAVFKKGVDDEFSA